MTDPEPKPDMNALIRGGPAKHDIFAKYRTDDTEQIPPQTDPKEAK